MPERWERLRNGQAISLNELDAAAAELIERCGRFGVWLLSGELGSGKTTLIKAVCVRLGVVGTMTSPTFSIVNEYDLRAGGKVYHFDFYRLRSEQEAFDIGAEEYFESGSYCFVEWPEKIPTLVPARHAAIRIHPDSRGLRLIEFMLYE